jgi:hypothetical protein
MKHHVLRKLGKLDPLLAEQALVIERMRDDSCDPVNQNHHPCNPMHMPERGNHVSESTRRSGHSIRNDLAMHTIIYRCHNTF